MTTAQLVQAVILVLVATTCTTIALRRLLPGTSHRLQAALARALSRPTRARATRAIGVWLQPAEAKAGGCGTGNGCGSCGGCGTLPAGRPALSDGALPLAFASRREPRK